MSNSKNNNPEGHNQYTNDSKSGSGAKQSAQPRNEDGQFTKKDSSSSSSSSNSSSGHKGHTNNPEGHNQYTK